MVSSPFRRELPRTPRVDKEIHGWRRSKDGAINLLAYANWGLPKSWLECEVPVLFDFDGLTRSEDFPGERDELPPSIMREEEWWNSRDAVADPLFCLLPKRFRGQAVYFAVKREMLPRIAAGEFKPLGWQEAHGQLNARYPEKPQAQSSQRFTNHRNWPWR